MLVENINPPLTAMSCFMGRGYGVQVFPRGPDGGVYLGGSRLVNDWSEKPDMELAKIIMERCCKLVPELGRPEDLKVIRHQGRYFGVL